ncbi:MAG TPA: outer membrane beta-barrel protein [Steroidobacteraceae bacterium]|nr:outer membrane beta-barrel protein [Steroidobacteraceae bacterium]
MKCSKVPLLAVPVLLSALSAAALAADEPAKPAAPSLTDVLAASNVTVSGYLDVSYQHLDGTGQFANGSPDRVFDARQDAFTLHQAAVTVGYQPKEGFGALVNLIAGQDADVFAPYDINPGAHSKFDFPQAYVQYATGPLTVIAGRFVTLAGFETIDPRTDTNFSRSILYGFAIPFAHTGIRATVVASDQLTVNVGIVNGWDDLKDTNSAKTLELGATFTPVKALSLTVDGYVGKERVGGLTEVGPEGQRKLVDVIGSWNITESLALVLNYDWGRQDGGAPDGGTARWNGLAGYLNYSFNDHWRASLRGEYFDDQDGYRTGFVQTWKEATLTVAWLPSKAVELRLEGRADRSDHPVFVKDGAYFTSEGDPRYLGDQQGSVAVEALFKF